MRRTRSFDFDDQQDVRGASTTQAVGADGEEDDGFGETTPSVMRHRRVDARGGDAEFRVDMFIHSHSSGAITDALSLDRPRYEHGDSVEETASEDGSRAMPYIHRRVKSYNGVANWQLFEPTPSRPRTYTKSLGSLVKHLTPSTDVNDVLPSPLYASPLAKLRSSLPKAWSPRSQADGTAIPLADYQIKYEFALVLHNKPTTPRILARNGLDAVGKRQMEVLSRCINAGLEVSVLSSSLYSRKYMVLLLRPSPSRLQIEKSRLVLERWLQIGAVGEVPSEIEQLIASSHIGTVQSPTTYFELYDDAREIPVDDDRKFTPAERIQTIARIITSTSNLEELN
ncbi:hypothetical protein BBJ28_00009314, partial [Nothophytophthora sp. Chile5]